MQNLPKIPQTIAVLLSNREKIEILIKEVRKKVTEIENLTSESEIIFHYELLREGRTEELIEKLDFAFWKHSFDILSITDSMTLKARDEFLNSIKSNEDKGIKHLPFTFENTESLRQNASEIFKNNSLNMVKELYKQLIACDYGRWNDPKRDNMEKVEPLFRTRNTDFGSSSWNPKIYEYSPNQNRGLHLNDLLTACFLLEGKGFPNYSNNFYALEKEQNPYGKNKIIKSEYFTVESYKNGNNKITWNSEKLEVLDKLNKFGNGDENILGEGLRKKYKKEHFKNYDKAKEAFSTDENYETNYEELGFFPTPDNVVKRMIELANFSDDGKYHYNEQGKILEPSAGIGNIVKFLPKNHKITMFEVHEQRTLELKKIFENDEEPNNYMTGDLDNRESFIRIYNEDFLKWNTLERFHRILMNPPFTLNRIELVHVYKAFDLLECGGILVTILPEGAFFRNDARSEVFREFMERHQMINEKVPMGSFKDSGTMINTRIVRLKK